MAKCIESTIGGAIFRFQNTFHEGLLAHHDVIHPSPTRPHATAGLRPPCRGLGRAHDRRVEFGRCDRDHVRRAHGEGRSRFAIAKQGRCRDWIGRIHAVAWFSV